MSQCDSSRSGWASRTEQARACLFQWDVLSTRLSYSFICSEKGWTLMQLWLAFVICAKFPLRREKVSSCCFRISICMLILDIVCVVPVSLPLIWLENKRPQARHGRRDFSSNSGFLFCVFSWVIPSEIVIGCVVLWDTLSLTVQCTLIIRRRSIGEGHLVLSGQLL